MRRRLSLIAVLLVAGAAEGCSSEKDDAAEPEVTTTREAAATVDGMLDERTIAVDGLPEVGAELKVRVSPDLVGAISEWSWHRCVRVPGCPTITSATGSRYVATLDDAWQVLRVIAVADGRAVETRVGPIVNPDPGQLRQAIAVDPSAGGAVSVIVAPGRTSVLVEARCPVVVVAGVTTATTDGSAVTGEAAGDDPATRHELTIASEGGQLTVAVTGACDEGSVAISGRR